MYKFDRIAKELAIEAAYDMMVARYQGRYWNKSLASSFIVDNYPYKESDGWGDRTFGDIYNIRIDLSGKVYRLIDTDEIQNEAKIKYIEWYKKEKRKHKPTWESGVL